MNFSSKSICLLGMALYIVWLLGEIYEDKTFEAETEFMRIIVWRVIEPINPPLQHEAKVGALNWISTKIILNELIKNIVLHKLAVVWTSFDIKTPAILEEICSYRSFLLTILSQNESTISLTPLVHILKQFWIETNLNQD